MMQVRIKNTSIKALAGDITEEETDAIVNPANPSLMGGGGADGAIHRKGGPDILKECKLIRQTMRRGIKTGEAVVTTGGALKTKKVIHTVGPVWKGGGEGESELLEKAYRSCLALALKTGLKRISFPSISTGAYGYPITRASRIAVRTVLDFIKENEGIEEVRFVLHTAHDLKIYEEALKESFL